MRNGLLGGIYSSRAGQRKTDWAGNSSAEDGLGGKYCVLGGEWADMGGHGRGMGVCVGLAEIGNVSEGRSVGNRAGVGNGRGSFTKSGN